MPRMKLRKYLAPILKFDNADNVTRKNYYEYKM